MVVEVAVMAAILAVGNVTFRHFDPKVPWWRPVLKALAVLSITAALSYYFGRTGVLIAFGVATVPVVYIHGVWLPRHGVHGWTGEPRERYHALRGWPPPEA